MIFAPYAQFGADVGPFYMPISTWLHLSPYSPELNPVERLWAYLRSHYLSNRAYKDYDDLLTASGKAWSHTHPRAVRLDLSHRLDTVRESIITRIMRQRASRTLGGSTGWDLIPGQL